MAREGNNILGVDYCNRPQPEYIRYQYDNDNPGGDISISPGSFTVGPTYGALCIVFKSFRSIFHAWKALQPGVWIQRNSFYSRAAECDNNNNNNDDDDDDDKNIT